MTGVAVPDITGVTREDVVARGVAELAKERTQVTVANAAFFANYHKWQSKAAESGISFDLTMVSYLNAGYAEWKRGLSSEDERERLLLLPPREPT